MSKGKMAIVLLVNDGEKHGRYSDPELVDSESTGTSLLQTLLSDDRTSLKVKGIFNFKSANVTFYLLCGR